MTAGTAVDPRPQFAAAVKQVEDQLAAVRPDDLGRRTPCAAYDVRALVAHLVAVLRKLTVVRNGGDMTRVPDPADDLTGDLEEAFRRARADVEHAWAPDAALDATHTMAWGTMTGQQVLEAYTHEFTVHAWDLSQVTGHGGDLDEALADAALTWFIDNVPAEGRGENGPFAVCPSPSRATPTPTPGSPPTSADRYRPRAPTTPRSHSECGCAVRRSIPVAERMLVPRYHTRSR